MKDTVLAILAGGRSSRFGSSKLSVHIAGTPVVAWASARLGPVAGGGVWLNVAPGAIVPGSEACARVIEDAEAFAGPLAGMHRLLQVAESERLGRLIVVAADMPATDAAHLRRLVETLDASPDAAGVMGQWRSGPRKGHVEPLPCVWRVGPGLRAVEVAIQRGERALHRLADYPAVAAMPLDHEADAGQYLNINRPDDLPAVAARLGAPVTAEQE